MAWCASLYLERVNEFATFDPNVKVASLGKVGQQPFSLVHCERRLQGGSCGGDTMPKAHSGMRNHGLSNESYQLPRDSPIRAVPKSANSTHIAIATNSLPILSERTDDSPLSYVSVDRLLDCERKNPR
jgi:hypothetical protein